MLTRRIQSPAKGIIQPYSGISRTLCNAWIGRNLGYSESWNIQNRFIIAYRRISRTLHINENLRIFRIPTYLKLDTCSKPSQRFRIEFFAKIDTKYNYFSKVLNLTCKVNSRYVLYDTYSKPALLS